MSAVVPHPRALELVARRQLRRKVEAAVDRLLAILDELDGDPDLELDDEGDELDAGEHDEAELSERLGYA